MITLTQAMRDKLISMHGSEDDLHGDLVLRILVAGGGCAGFSYELRFEDSREIGIMDEIVETIPCGTNNKIEVIIDPVSLQYLEGSTVDYVKKAMSEGFKFTNPNVVATCGCGNSFAV